MSSFKILAIIPAFNEEGNIRPTVDELAALPFPVDVLVVDDGSADGTAAEARATSARVVSLPFNLGVGGAVQTGLIYAARHGYDFAVQVDGDGQHDAAYLAPLMEVVRQGAADIVIGSRFLPPYLGYRSSFFRRIGINFFAWLISGLTRARVTDPTSGFRVFNRRAIEIFAEEYPTDFPEPESIVIARRAGLKIVEVPVQMRQRACGVSSIRYFATFYYMVKVTFAILLRMIKTRKKISATSMRE